MRICWGTITQSPARRTGLNLSKRKRFGRLQVVVVEVWRADGSEYRTIDCRDMSSTPSSQAARFAGTPRLQKRLADCYERGMHLMAHERDHDYAHVMFAECVLQDPANLRYAEALLQNLRDKFAGRAKRRWRFLGRGGSKELRKATASRTWKDVFHIAVDLLKDDPWDVATLRVLAEACAELHYNEAELAYLKQALDANVQDAEVNRHCGRSLARMGQFDQAIACWHRVEEIKKGDAEAARMVAGLYEEKLKYPGGRPPTIRSPVDTALQSAEVVEVPEAESAIVLTPWQLLERAITDNPTDPSNYLALAELLEANEQYENAEAILLRAIAACGNGSVLSRRLQEVRSRRLQRDLAAAASLQTESLKEERHFHVPWLEAILAATIGILILQVIPSTAAWVGGLINVRNWSRLTWLMVNIYGVLILIAIRFGPEVYGWWRKL